MSERINLTMKKWTLLWCRHFGCAWNAPCTKTRNAEHGTYCSGCS